MTFFLDVYGQFKWSFTLVDSQLISIAYVLVLGVIFAYMSPTCQCLGVSFAYVSL